MAAGLYDVLALQGVIPLSKPLVVSTPGSNINQLSGVWVNGSTSVSSTAGDSWLKLSGVWLTNGTLTVIPTTSGGRVRPKFYYGEPEQVDPFLQARREDEELLEISLSFLRLIL